MKRPEHDNRAGARIPIPAMLAPNGPGFAGLYAGDTVEFLIPAVRTRHGMGHIVPTVQRAAVLPLLVFPTHVQVRYGKFGYTVNASNFVRLVRRGKRHMQAVRSRFTGIPGVTQP